MHKILEHDSPYRPPADHKFIRPAAVIDVARQAHERLDAQKKRVAMTPGPFVKLWDSVEDILGEVAAYGDLDAAALAMLDVDGGREEDALLSVAVANVARDGGQTLFRLGMMSQDPRFFGLAAQVFGQAEKMVKVVELSSPHAGGMGYTAGQIETMHVAEVEKEIMRAMANPEDGGNFARVISAESKMGGNVDNPDAIFAVTNWILHDSGMKINSSSRRVLEAKRIRAAVLRRKGMSYSAEYIPSGMEIMAARAEITGYNLVRETVLAIQRMVVSAGPKEDLFLEVKGMVEGMPFWEKDWQGVMVGPKS